MRLIVNLSMLGPRPTGLGVYADKCLSYLSSRYSLEYVSGHNLPYAGKVFSEAPSSVAIGGGVSAAVRRQYWARGVKFPESSLLYSPTHHGFSGAKRQILTIHDLICLRHPRQHLPQYFFFKHFLPKILARCEAVFAVSETTKFDVAETYGFPLDRIFVVPNSVARMDFLNETGKSHSSCDPYLLMVGARYQHKNVDEVLDVHEMWSKSYRLIITSCGGKYKDNLVARVGELGLSERVEFKSYVSSSELAQLYKNASALVYPSKWEGFGIPPLEALASGCRVILSDIPVHKEIFNGACDFVSLGCRDSWGDALERLSRPEDDGMNLERVRVLEKYTPENTGRQLERALLAVDPNVSALRL